MKKTLTIFLFLCSLCSYLSANHDIICVAAPSVDLNVLLAQEEAKDGHGGSLIVDSESFDILLKSIHADTLKISAGGSGANTIRALGHLGNRCAIIGHIGTDPMKEIFLDALRKANVTPLLTYSQMPTQQVLCYVTPDKQRTFRVSLGAMLEFKPEHISPKNLEGARLVHIEGYLVYNPGIVEKSQQIAREVGAIISMDVGCYQIAAGHKDKLLGPMSKYIDILFANTDEAFALTGLPPRQACEYLQKIFPISVVLMGAEGCLVGSKGKIIHVSTTDVAVVDTVGAGDYFAAGFLHGILQNLPLKRCAEIGNKLGSSIVQVGGTCLPDEIWPKVVHDVKEIGKR